VGSERGEQHVLQEEVSKGMGVAVGFYYMGK
jgi:hypothetical protein